METALLELDPEVLIAEVERYLAAVELFRAEGCPPRWANEGIDDPDGCRVRVRANTPSSSTEGASA
jgi:hypothetical protein